MPDKRCCCDHRSMDVITCNTQRLSLITVTRSFFKFPWKRFSFIFLFSPWRRYHRFIKFVRMMHPCLLLVSFDELLSASTKVTSKTWTRDALKVDNTGFSDKTCLRFRSRYMWRIMYGNQHFFSGIYRFFFQMNSSYTYDHYTSKL